MFATRVDRKRSRKSLEESGGRRSGASALSTASIFSLSKTKALCGVIACLSGYTPEEKNKLHALIETLGGSYTRDFNLDKNTHLITEAPTGAKYDLAVSNDAKIRIVTSSWLRATFQSSKKANEADHKLSIEPKQMTCPTLPSLISMANAMLAAPSGDSKDRSSLWEHCHFHFLGFEKGHNMVYPFEQVSQLQRQLSMIIRRAGGTIYWELNEDVSILVLCDGCDDILHKGAEILSTHHPQLPPSVSPLWILESWKQNKLQPVASYIPLPAPPNPCHQSSSQLSTQEVRRSSWVSKSAPTSTSSTLSVFRGCLFSLLRVPPQDDSVLDFDMHELESLLKSHGGQILTSTLLEALRADSKQRRHQGHDGGNGNVVGSKRRKCHVVCWGHASGPPPLETNPLVAQLQREGLCEILLVTPLWIQTSVTVRKRVGPDRLPVILSPQPWPMRSLVPKRVDQKRGKDKGIGASSDGAGDTKKKGKDNRKPVKGLFPSALNISLTGFQGTEKAALIHLIGAVGGLYHDNMSHTNTHLICKDKATGIKREKAIEWRLKVVTIHWLYHVLQHGYGGENGDENGCESRFSAL